MTPTQNGHWFWSGTRTLIFSPDPDTPFPYATRYAVHIDASATSLTGHTLGSPFEFDFHDANRAAPADAVVPQEWPFRRSDRVDVAFQSAGAAG